MGAPKLTTGDYDNDHIGVGAANHPANEVETDELTYEQRLEEYVLRQNSELRELKTMVKEMEVIEASGNCRVAGLSIEDENQYIKLREKVRYRLKSLGHGID